MLIWITHNMSYTSCLGSNLTQCSHINSALFKLEKRKKIILINDYKNIINNFSDSFLFKAISFSVIS